MFFSNLFGLNSLVILVSILVTVLIALYLYLRRNFNYFKSQGMDGPKPIVVMGTLYQLFFKDMFENNLNNVRKYGKIYGIFMGDRPVLVLAEPELIKEITIRDFHLFVDRGDLVTGDPMNDRSLANVFGDEWKKLRSIISPTFSSGKMRRMHPIIVDCVQTLQTNLEKNMKNKNEVEIKKLMSNFTIDVIASCAFGTKIDVYSDEKNEFLVNAQKVFRGTWRMWAFFTLSFISPKLIRFLKLSFFEHSVTNFFKKAIRSIISRRESENGEYKDYIQLMINARNRVADNDDQDIDDDNSEEIFRQSDDRQTVNNTKVKGEISEMEILATSLIFFVAGYETTAATLSHLFYSLAMNEECQQTLYKEVQKYGPNFSYEDIARMPYLEACVAETLRLYNPVTNTQRIASEDYKLGDTGFTIPKGMMLNMDMHSIHRNPEYYEEPEKFDPERFMPENRDKLIPYTYLPFGMGPRNCVGMRFALMEAKTAVAFLIYKYRFFKTANTQNKLKPKKFEFLMNVGDIPIGMEIRKKSIPTNGKI